MWFVAAVSVRHSLFPFIRGKNSKWYRKKTVPISFSWMKKSLNIQKRRKILATFWRHFDVKADESRRKGWKKKDSLECGIPLFHYIIVKQPKKISLNAVSYVLNTSTLTWISHEPLLQQEGRAAHCLHSQKILTTINKAIK